MPSIIQVDKLWLESSNDEQKIIKDELLMIINHKSTKPTINDDELTTFSTFTTTIATTTKTLENRDKCGNSIIKTTTESPSSSLIPNEGEIITSSPILATTTTTTTAAPYLSPSSSTSFPESSPRWCSRASDSVSCWPQTLAGTLASIPCFKELNGVHYDNTDKNATRFCYSNGTWARSDYNSCNETINMLYHDELQEVSGAIKIYLVGYGISLLALIIALGIFVCLKELRCIRNTIHTNLMMTNLLLNSVWLMSFTLQGDPPSILQYPLQHHHTSQSQHHHHLIPLVDAEQKKQRQFDEDNNNNKLLRANFDKTDITTAINNNSNNNYAVFLEIEKPAIKGELALSQEQATKIASVDRNSLNKRETTIKEKLEITHSEPPDTDRVDTDVDEVQTNDLENTADTDFATIATTTSSTTGKPASQRRNSPRHSENGTDCYLAVLLAYAIGANSYWMFVEGLYLYELVVATLSIKTVNVTLYMFIGWGIPAIFITVWACLKHYYALKEDYSGCPVHFSGDFLIDAVFVLPVMVVLMVNIFFMGKVMSALLSTVRAPTTESRQYKKASRALLILMPLLGANHLIMIVPPETGWPRAVFIYFRAFVLSFQGFIVAVLYCFWNGEVRSCLINRWQRWRAVRRLRFNLQDYPPSRSFRRESTPSMKSLSNGRTSSLRVSTTTTTTTTTTRSNVRWARSNSATTTIIG